MLRACAALLFAVCLANTILLFYPLMIEGRVMAYENIIWVRTMEFAMSVGLCILGAVAYIVSAWRAK